MKMWKQIVLIITMGFGMLAWVPAITSMAEQIEKESQNYGETVDLTITNARELKEFSAKVANGNTYEGKTVVLANDIVLDGRVGNFEPIDGFAGTFDGQGHTVSGIHVKTNEYNMIGFFAYLSNVGEVKNLIVKNSIFDCTDGDEIAGLVGKNLGIIRNCAVVDSKIVGSSEYDNCYVGGLVGWNYAGRILNSYSLGNTISGTGNYPVVGGICGWNRNEYGDECRIENCGNISTVSSTFVVGGVVGQSNNNFVRNCYNAGTVSRTGEKDDYYIGGIAGYSSGNVIYCYTSEESSEMNFGAMTGLEEGNKAYPTSYMQTTDFLNILNADLSYCEEWIPWEIRSESPYPLPMELTNITDCNIALSKTTCTYNGKEQTPGVVLTYNGKNLIQNVDYSVEYNNNINAGTATITITGKGVYQGTASVNFNIQKAVQTFKYTKSYKKAYNSRPFRLSAKLKSGNGALFCKSSNAKVASVGETGWVTVGRIGTAVITVTAKGTANYKTTSIEIPIKVSPIKLTIQLAKIKKNRLNVSWTRDSKAKGYEIQYATDKKFKNNVKIIKIKKNAKVSYKSKKVKKGKKYYVRVRAYKGNIYGAWSKIAVVKR